MENKRLILFTIAFVLVSPMENIVFCDQMQKRLLPKYDETKLKENFDKWISSLNYMPVANDYAKPIKGLFTADRKQQLTSIKTIGNTGDIRVIPWLLPFLDVEDSEIRVWAGSSIEKIVSDVVHQDNTNQEKNKKDLKPLAWLVLKLFQKPDDGNTHGYAAQITAILEFDEFKEELLGCIQSRHPAVNNSAQYALKVLGLSDKETPNKIDADVDKNQLLNHENKNYKNPCNFPNEQLIHKCLINIIDEIAQIKNKYPELVNFNSDDLKQKIGSNYQLPMGFGYEHNYQLATGKLYDEGPKFGPNGCYLGVSFKEINELDQRLENMTIPSLGVKIFWSCDLSKDSSEDLCKIFEEIVCKNLQKLKNQNP